MNILNIKNPKKKSTILLKRSCNMEKEEMEKMENENIRQDIKDRKDSIIEDLRLISKIEPGQTISFVTREIMDHNSWYTSIRRSCYREDRGKTVSRIKSIFLESLFFYRCYKDDMVLFEIQNAKKGIESLEVTYSKDFNTLGILKEISDIIEKNLKEFAKRGTLEPIDSQYIENIYETLHDNEAYTEKKNRVTSQDVLSHQILKRWSRQQIQQATSEYFKVNPQNITTSVAEKIIIAIFCAILIS